MAFGLNDDANTPAVSSAQVTTDLIANIKPRPAPRPAANIAESDKAAAAAGFTSREPAAKTTLPYDRPTRRKRKLEQCYPLSMRTPVSILERFIRYAEEHKLSYPLALESLLDESDKLANLRAGRL
jgi:hypothetical protein